MSAVRGMGALSGSIRSMTQASGGVSSVLRMPARAMSNVDQSKIKRFTPRTPSLRHTVLIDRSELWKGRPIKELTKGLRKTGGRNNTGKITVRHIGGGHKRLYRFVDLKREVRDMPGTVERLEYDPNRTCHIALVSYPDNQLAYILLPQKLKIGDTVESSATKELEIKVGNAMPLRNVPIGTFIHNVEHIPGKGGAFARSAGCSAQLLDKKTAKTNYGLVRMASKEQRLIHLDSFVTIGQLSNPLHKIRKLGKAGRSRWLGNRPTVRGTAMNPVDHPHGGREGKGRPGRPSVSFNGILAKGGFKTRKKSKRSDMIMVPRGGPKAKKGKK